MPASAIVRSLASIVTALACTSLLLSYARLLRSIERAATEAGFIERA